MGWGILGAVNQEILAVIDNLTRRKKFPWKKRSVYQGKIGDSDVVVMATGVGKVAAAAAAQFVIDRFSVDCIVFTGVAGSVNPEIKVGDIVVCEKTVQHDFDMGGHGVFEKMGTPWFDSEPELVQLALQAGKTLGWVERIKTGILLTGDQAIISSPKREWLWEKFHGDCVDMEGASVAMVCSCNEIPFLIIRTITDRADENARADFRRTMSGAMFHSATMVLTMLNKGAKMKGCQRSLVSRVKKLLLTKKCSTGI